MKYLKYLKESKDYSKEIKDLYYDIFNQVFNQNVKLKKEMDYINDLFLEIFDEIGIYPQQEFKIFFYEPNAEKMSHFCLRLYEGELDDIEIVGNELDDYQYIKNIISEYKDVYIYVFYRLNDTIRNNKNKYDFNEINRRLILMDFEPVHFSSTFDDSDRNNIGCYKEVNFEYEFDYLNDFPDVIKNDIKKFVTKNKLNDNGIKELSKIISKLSTNK